MNTDQLLAEIREANLSHLMLAQNLIRTDREQALYRLGINEETGHADCHAQPGADHEDRRRQHLLCAFRMSDDLVWGPLYQPRQVAAAESVNRPHASIPMAGRHEHA